MRAAVALRRVGGVAVNEPGRSVSVPGTGSCASAGNRPLLWIKDDRPHEGLATSTVRS
ncbi:hypothetical protein PKCBPO_00778 [Methylorubrum thiocyanatum]